MNNLHIIIITDIQPNKVNLHTLTLAIEKLIEVDFNAVCHEVSFMEVTNEEKDLSKKPHG